MSRLILMLYTLVVGSLSYSDIVVDISHWQDRVDFKLVKADGIEAVIHKATEGKTYVDKKYTERRRQAEAEGLLWGAYHFGVGGVSGKAQADHFLGVVGDTSGTLLALDLEPNPAGGTMGLDEAEEFLGRIREVAGRLPLVYGSSFFLSSYSNSTTISQCPLWVAHWTKADTPLLPRGQPSWVLWQYTSEGYVDGLGRVDRDRYNGTPEQLRIKWPNL